MTTKYESTVWEVWIYEVWGNETDGYDVNNRSCVEREYPLRLAVTVNNAGKTGEFISAYPSDRQLRKLFGIVGRIETTGDDLHISVECGNDGYPVGELTCISHDSLSPIRRKVTA